jgi:hypothetical protein
MNIVPVLAFTAGCVAGVATCVVSRPSMPAQARVLDTGILDGWTLVRDDETMLCESPAIFAAARQIECP